MRYVPDEKPKETLKDKSIRWLGWVAAFILLGPFALVYLVAFMGGPMPGGWFSAWFMGALTVGGAITTFDHLKSVRSHGLGELGCVIPLAVFTFGLGYVFLKEIGLVE